MKAIPKVDLNGIFVGDELVEKFEDQAVSEVKQSEEDGSENIVGYLVNIPIQGTFYKLQFNVEKYQAAQKKYQKDVESAIADNTSLPEQPNYSQFWEEGLSEADIAKLKSKEITQEAPEQKIIRLEQENIESQMALIELHSMIIDMQRAIAAGK